MKSYYWCSTLTCVLAVVVADQMEQILECESDVLFCCALQNITIDTNFKLRNPKDGTAHSNLCMRDVTIRDNSNAFFQRLPGSFSSLDLIRCQVPQLLIPSSVLRVTVLDPVGQYDLIIPDGNDFKLQFLQLSNLTALPHNLDKLTSLLSLVIYHSSIDSVRLDSLASLANLQKLKIFNGTGNTVQSAGHLRLSNLSEFYMGMNNLSELDMHRWDFPVLELLYLKENRMLSVPNGIGNFPYLKIVDLSLNFIKHVNMHDFDGLTKIQVLTLQGNQLVKLYSDNLVTLPKLQHLGLERNQLEFVDLANISIPTKYFRLNLACNNLSDVRNWPVEAPDWEVSFVGNRWKCDYLEDTFARNLPNLLPNEAADNLENDCERKVRGVCCFDNLDETTSTFASAGAARAHCKLRPDNDRHFDRLKDTYMQQNRTSTMFYSLGKLMS